jgi:hypothetical protein
MSAPGQPVRTAALAALASMPSCHRGGVAPLFQPARCTNRTFNKIAGLDTFGDARSLFVIGVRFLDRRFTGAWWTPCAAGVCPTNGCGGGRLFHWGAKRGSIRTCLARCAEHLVPSRSATRLSQRGVPADRHAESGVDQRQPLAIRLCKRMTPVPSPPGNALNDSTLAQDHGDLERRLDRLLAAAVPDKPAARRLFRAMRRDRDDLFRFITRRDVPYTNKRLRARTVTIGDLRASNLGRAASERAGERALRGRGRPASPPARAPARAR